jgi:CheY-specific phosphatase CheX
MLPVHMLREQASAALAGAARDVLETMCFVAAEEVSVPLPCGAAPIAAQVEFRGHWTGRCTVEMPEACAQLVTGNFMGDLDPSHTGIEAVTELLCELVNMVCGSAITRLNCPGIVTLAPPHLLWEWPESSPENSTVECWLDTGDGTVRVGLDMEPLP